MTNTAATSHVALTLSLVKFSHSVFALPFALMGAWLAAGGVPEFSTLGLIVLAVVAARTSAMAFNRLVDRDIDAANPRTAEREIPSGKLGAANARGLTAASAAVFVVAAFSLNSLAGWLSPLVLFVLLGYSYVKRFSAAVHFVLGFSLALAPLGAWIAVRGSLGGDVVPVLLLFVAVWTWVAGFDLIYACQDVAHDRSHGLHSIPARMGVAKALLVSRTLHAGTVAALSALCFTAGLGWIFAIAVVIAAALLVWEHSLVHADDLTRVNIAFFTVNGWVGFVLFLGLAIDIAVGSAGR